MNKYKGELGLFITAAIWGTGFVGTAIALQTMGPFQVTALRFTLGSFLLVALFYKKLRALDKQTIKFGTILGGILFLSFALQTTGLVYTTPAKNAFITGLNVVFVPFIGAVIFKTKIEINGIIGAVVAFLGIAMLSLNFDSPVNIGDVLTLGCAIAYAFHIFYTNDFVAKRGLDIIKILMVQMITVSVLSIISAIIFGETDFSKVTPTAILVVVYLGVFSTTLCFFLQTWAQKFTSATKTAIILAMETVFGATFSVLVLHEILTGRMLVGCLMILIAILIAELKVIPKKVVNTN